MYNFAPSKELCNFFELFNLIIADGFAGAGALLHERTLRRGQTGFPRHEG